MAPTQIGTKLSVSVATIVGMIGQECVAGIALAQLIGPIETPLIHLGLDTPWSFSTRSSCFMSILRRREEVD